MRFILTILSACLMSACATAYQERSTATGATVGAVAGAVIGAQNDRAAEGAVIGAVIGGLAGAIMAEDRSNRVYTSEPRFHRRACHDSAGYFGRAHRSRHLDRKIELMRHGLRYCPNNPAAHNDLGVALLLWGDRAGASIHFNHAIRLDSHYRPAHRNLMWMKRRNPQRHYEERREDHRSNRYREHDHKAGKHRHRKHHDDD